jgi:hypothetical protein
MSLNKEQMREYQRSRREKGKEPYIDIVHDLGLDPEKDLGIKGWNADGIFLNEVITVAQVQNIARLVHARHGRPCPKFFGEGGK